ncbi:polyprenyl synthetase family protein [Nocardia sp. NPDC005825]|uniref:polyprenyl synthetase family protein n=1 Tax=unclassified Nocardia TaxID=2637762 RepID=UPI003410DC9B
MNDSSFSSNVDPFRNLEVLESQIVRWWDGPDRLSSICRYALLPPGKMFRPVLLVEAGLAVGGELDHLLPAAVGTEFGHVASLIHDDIIDHDDFRRGRPSVHAQHGLANAILSGDALFFSLFEGLVRCHRNGAPAEAVVAALDVVTEVGVALCRGQMREDEITGDLNADPDDYRTVIQLKTASLFRGACGSGAILGGGDAEQIQALERYGESLGMAFQLVDDLLPYTSSRETTGKPLESDIRNKRITLPILETYRLADAGQRRLIEGIFGATDPDEDDARRIRVLVHSVGAVDSVAKHALAEAEEARNALVVLPNSGSKAILERFVELAILRLA